MGKRILGWHTKLCTFWLLSQWGKEGRDWNVGYKSFWAFNMRICHSKLIDGMQNHEVNCLSLSIQSLQFSCYEMRLHVSLRDNCRKQKGQMLTRWKVQDLGDLAKAVAYTRKHKSTLDFREQISSTENHTGDWQPREISIWSHLSIRPNFGAPLMHLLTHASSCSLIHSQHVLRVRRALCLHKSQCSACFVAPMHLRDTLS